MEAEHVTAEVLTGGADSVRESVESRGIERPAVRADVEYLAETAVEKIDVDGVSDE